MLNAFIKLLVSKLNGILVLVTLTGFVCTHKIQAEEECLSSNILCYECDSRYDPNCADPFDFSSLMPGEYQYNSISSENLNHTSASHSNEGQRQLPKGNQTYIVKKLPNVAVCHGCCVKLTSKTPEGNTYVKRTCTTNLQINYFMVGLVCMKESGDRGKMCFCETDFCNGQMSTLHDGTTNGINLLLTILAFLYMTTNSSIHLPLLKFYTISMNMLH